MTIDDVVMLFEGDRRMTVAAPVGECVSIKCGRDFGYPAVDVLVRIPDDAPMTVRPRIESGSTDDVADLPDPRALIVRLMIASEVVETLRTSGVVDGQRVGGA